MQKSRVDVGRTPLGSVLQPVDDPDLGRGWSRKETDVDEVCLGWTLTDKESKGR